MNMNRRAFGAGLAGLAATLLIPRRVLACAVSRSSITVQELRTGVWVLSQRGGRGKTAGNALLIATEDGPVLVDTMFGSMSDDLLSDVVRLGGRGPTAIINSHHHPDHTGGNFIFTPKPRIIAHANLAPRLSNTIETQIKPMVVQQARALRARGDVDQAQELLSRAATFRVDDFAPTQTLTDELKLTIGGVDIEIHHLGAAHTDNDIIVMVPGHGIVHMGDLLWTGLHAFIDRSSGASAAGWQAALAKADSLLSAGSIVVPGHGTLTDRTALPVQSAYFDQLRDVVSAAIDEGRTRDEIRAMKPDVFRDLGFKQLEPKCLDAMYDELAG